MHALHKRDFYMPLFFGLQYSDTWLSFSQLQFSGAGGASAEAQSGGPTAHASTVVAGALHADMHAT